MKYFEWIPNSISISRILFAFVFVWSGFAQQHRVSALGIGLLAYLLVSDWLDGFIARKLNVVSDLGKILDPLADKIAFCVLGIYFALFYHFPLWIVILIILRELIVLIVGFVIMRRLKNVPVSNWGGKLSTSALAFAMLGCYFGPVEIMNILIIIFLFFYGLSSIWYGWKTFKSGQIQ